MFPMWIIYIQNRRVSLLYCKREKQKKKMFALYAKSMGGRRRSCLRFKHFHPSIFHLQLTQPFAFVGAAAVCVLLLLCFYVYSTGTGIADERVAIAEGSYLRSIYINSGRFIVASYMFDGLCCVIHHNRIE